MVEQRLPPGFATPQLVHHNEDEAFSLLSGRMVAQLGDRQISAGTGSILWLPRGVQHGFTVDADGPCTILIITTPSGFAQAPGPVQKATIRVRAAVLALVPAGKRTTPIWSRPIAPLRH